MTCELPVYIYIYIYMNRLTSICLNGTFSVIGQSIVIPILGKPALKFKISTPNVMIKGRY